MSGGTTDMWAAVDKRRVNEQLRDALLAALDRADEAGNTLVAAMLADCLAQIGWQEPGDGGAH